MANNDLFDLGSEPVGEDFDPWATDETEAANEGSTDAETETNAEQTNDSTDTNPEQSDDAPAQQAEAATPEKPKTAPAETTAKKADAKEADAQDYADKLPVFEYAGATENIDDVSKTFDELRIEKSSDFPELEDGKRVSWTMEYGKLTKTVADPKGTSIGKMKTDIEASKEFADNLKKRGAERNPVCKVKPRVTAQSKGTPTAYKGVFTSVDEAEAAGKVISIVPARDGRVYEIRNTEMGRFTTPVSDCDMLSEVRAGFIPALPRIPAELMTQIFAFFHYFTRHGADNEALLNIYWDKHNKEFIVDAPEQVVTKVSVDSHISEEFTDDRYIHYMDIHSHNSMQAFFSSIDDHDEKATRLYAVVGKLNECVPEIKTRFSNGGKFHEIDPAEVFEFAGTPFPDEWKDKVKFRSPHGIGIPKAISKFKKIRKKIKKGIRHAVRA